VALLFYTYHRHIETPTFAVKKRWDFGFIKPDMKSLSQIPELFDDSAFVVKEIHQNKIVFRPAITSIIPLQCLKDAVRVDKLIKCHNKLADFII